MGGARGCDQGRWAGKEPLERLARRVKNNLAENEGDADQWAQVRLVRGGAWLGWEVVRWWKETSKAPNDV